MSGKGNVGIMGQMDDEWGLRAEIKLTRRTVRTNKIKDAELQKSPGDTRSWCLEDRHPQGQGPSTLSVCGKAVFACVGTASERSIVWV